jgi:hypothetical protein
MISLITWQLKFRNMMCENVMSERSYGNSVIISICKLHDYIDFFDWLFDSQGWEIFGLDQA